MENMAVNSALQTNVQFVLLVCNCLVRCCQHSCFLMRLVIVAVFLKAFLLESRHFFLSLKQHVSGPCPFDEENGPQRFKSKETNEKNPTFITWKTPKPCDF